MPAAFTVIPPYVHGARFNATAQLVAGVGVLTISGRLGTQALAQCRAAIDALLQEGPRCLVLDVRWVTLDPESITLLCLIRRYTARRGAQIWLAAPPRTLVQALRDAEVDGLYDVLPSVGAAVETAVAATRRTPALA